MILRRWLPIVLLSLSSVEQAAAQGFGQPLTAAQVACEESQLTRLIHRMVVSYDGSNLFVWRSSPEGGIYRGLATTSRLLPDPLTGLPTREEEQLPFDLVLKQEEDFLDPHRLLLPQATLVRRDAASNLSSAPVGPQILDVNFDLAQTVPDPTIPGLPIRITDRLTPGAGQSDRAGRGLNRDALLTACHAEVSELDLKIYSILARTVRVSDCLAQPALFCDAVRLRFKSVFFRAAEPLSYRMNILEYVVTCEDNGNCFYGEGQIALVFHIQVDAQGRLTGGDVQALPWCTGSETIGCTTTLEPDLAVFVLPPLRPGTDRQGDAAFARGAHLNISNIIDPGNILHDNVNWLDLLRDSTWNQRFFPQLSAPVCSAGSFY
ncbi:MAG TPA: hypothetical protein VOA87_08745 [Thermoanaerobaculia bacterium]|nr:hypothetical protein [Thermoanaerobaculia bacterium]